MKYNRIISFTLFNGFVLLSFASILASCEKKVYPASGYFSQAQGRSIASFGPKESSFSDFQDPKQIYIYCHLNLKNADSCFSEKLQKSMTKYEEKFGKLENKQEILDGLGYEIIKAEMDQSLNELTQKLEPQINKWVNKRFQFCKSNAKYFIDKCVKQNIEKDTFTVLNQFHKENKMNGQEYLFVKSAIQNKMNHSLSVLKQMNPKL